MGLQVYYFSTLIYFHTISRRAAKALVRLGGCTVSPEPSLKTCAIVPESQGLEQTLFMC